MRSCCDANGGDLRYTLISLSHASLLVVGIRACKVMGEIRFAGSVFLARSFYHDAIVCLLASSRAVVCLIVSSARFFRFVAWGRGTPKIASPLRRNECPQIYFKFDRPISINAGTRGAPGVASGSGTIFAVFRSCNTSAILHAIRRDVAPTRLVTS